MLDRPLSGRVFFEQVIRDNLDAGPPRPGQPDLRPAHPPRPQAATPGRFRTRVITEGVTPSLHIDYKHTRIKQYHKEGRALRTETTINDTRDFGIGKRLTNLPALREIGFSANRRLLGVQRLSHNPIRAAEAFTAVHDPIITDDRTRASPGCAWATAAPTPCCRPCWCSGCCPHGFLNRDLRALLARLLGTTTDDISAGQISYDLRRLRAHGLITRVPRSHRYRVTDTGLHHAMLLTHLHDPAPAARPGPAHRSRPAIAQHPAHRRPQLPTRPRPTHPAGRTRRMNPNLTRSSRLRRP